MRKEDRAEIIQDALNLLDDELILEADELREKAANTNIEHGSISKINTDNKRTHKKIGKSWHRFMALAASVAVFFIAGFVWSRGIVPNGTNTQEGYLEERAVEDTQKKDVVTDELNAASDAEEVVKSESQMLQESQVQIHLPDQRIEELAGVESLASIEIPALEVELGKNDLVEADMMGFFIYEGRCYVQSEYYKSGFSLVGDYVGTSIGMIDEWTKEEGYVDYAGSVSGKFYEVKGYDPSFMLCMKYENGAVETFINNNGIILGKGSDLMEDRLHLKENFGKVTFKTQKEWNETLEEENSHVLPEEYDELMERFFDSFSSGDFVYIKDTTLDVNGASRYHENMDNYHLTFYTKDGLRFDFVLYEDGYVSFHGFDSVCVQIEPSLYEDMIEVLKKES